MVPRHKLGKIKLRGKMKAILVAERKVRQKSVKGDCIFNRLNYHREYGIDFELF